MRISTTKEKILNAVLLSERIVGKKESLPILSCILLDVQKNLSVRATNLEAGIEVSVVVDVIEKGTIAVAANILSQTLRFTGRDKLTLRAEGGNLVVESHSTKTLIKAIPHGEFPGIGATTDSGAVTLPREKLLRGIQAVMYAASQSMIRPELGSVYISIRDGSVICVATDSFRLAEKIIPLGTDVSEKNELLLPLKHALEAAHVLERIQSDTIDLSIEDSQMSIVGGGVRYVSRVIDASFPNYKEIIPKQFTTEVTVLKGDFVEMLRKSRIFSGGEQHVGLHLYPKRKIFTATASSNNVGEMSDSIDAALSGEDLDINFHIGYLADCFSSIESDSITLNFAGVGRPLVIKGVSDASFTYLVMPLNR